MTDPISRLTAALEGRYRIQRELGEGGMARVYLADDLKHDRQVALKVLKPELAAIVGADRFLAEIKTTASLHHPHILPLFDSGEADGFLYYVTPYVRGESLRERLDRERQLPVDDAVRIATDLAEALDHAHRQGVIHRDIKPANVLMVDGRPVISDFGIALAVGAAGGGRLTETGLSVGTPHYMSPEQATGDQRVGPAADIYALGCVLYEMLVGEPPFTGSTPQAVLGRIITGEIPSASSQRRTVPANVDATIRKALEKLPADRFGSAAAFQAALEDDGFRYELAAPGRAAPIYGADSRHPGAHATSDVVHRWAFLAVSIVAMAASAVAAWTLFGGDTPSPPIRLNLDLGELRPGRGEEVAVSPDGRTFVVSAAAEGGDRMLWVRRADEAEFRPIPGSDGASGPDFSPDGRSLVYTVPGEHEVRRTRLAGGSPITLTNVAPFRPLQPHWGDDGRIVFTIFDRGVMVVPETGGEAEEVIGGGPDPYRNPRLLPGGRGLIVTDRLSESVIVADLEAGGTRVLVREGVDAHYLPTGHLLYAHPRGGLRAVPFDVDRLELTGPSVPVLDGVGQRAGLSPFAVSREGTLVYSTAGGAAPAASSRGLAIADLATGELQDLPVPPGDIMGPRFSPDGRRLAYAAGEERLQIMVYDLDAAGPPRQRTFTGDNIFPVWSPDGNRIVFNSRRAGSQGSDLYTVSQAGDEAPRLLLEREGIESPLDWPADDRLLFAQIGRDEVWIVDPTSRETTLYLGRSDDGADSQSDAVDDARIAPDGSLVAYSSEEGGIPEIYVRSFPEARQPTRISFGGGRFPAWGPNGESVYFWRRDTLFATSIRRDPEVVVLDTRAVLRNVEVLLPFWDLHPDGDRAVLRTQGAVPDDEGADEGDAEVDAGGRWLVVVHWFTELQARLTTS